jgi:hypothetical protein
MRRLALPLASLLLAAASGCAGGGLGGLFGGSSANARALRLQRLHDPETFAHAPDTPATADSCLEEIRAMGSAEYGTWVDLGEAVFLLTRAATEDPSALGRGEAVGALSRLGALVAAVEDPAAAEEPPPDARAAAARLEAIHPGKEALHGGPGAAAECGSLVRALGAVRGPAAPEGGREAIRAGLDAIRRAIRAIVVSTRAEREHADEEVRAAVDRALVGLSVRAARAALAEAGLHDADERVRGAAWHGLGSVGGEGLAAVLRRAYVSEGIAAVRREIVQSLGGRAALGPGAERDEAVPVLIFALDDDDRSVAFNAREALRDLAGEDLGARPDPWKKWWAGQPAGP